MAVKSATYELRDDSVVVITWSGLGNGDTGAPATIGRYEGKTVQVTGTFGSGGNVDIEGSNDNSNWGTLTDESGNTSAFTDETPKFIQQSPLYMRPNVSAGDSNTDLTVTLVAPTR